MMKRLLAIILSLILSLLLVGCTDQAEPPLSNKIQEDRVKSFYLTEESAENLISVQVPVVTTANAQAVNACIKEQVYNELQHWLLLEKCNLKESATPIASISERIDPSEYSTQFLHISSHLSFESEEFISLVFTGMHNVKSAAHPNEVFFSINVDVRLAERVGIADIYAVDDSLYTAFLQYVNSERVSNNELMSLNVFEKDVFLEGLTQEPEKGFYSYFTPTHVGISCPVIYALGNHIEAEIPKQTVDGLRRPSSKNY